MPSLDEAEGHNWIFSADQLENEASGMEWNSVYVLWKIMSFMCIAVVILSLEKNLLCPVGEDSGWHFFQDPTNSIGHSNGDHDLANTVLQVWLCMSISQAAFCLEFLNLISYIVCFEFWFIIFFFYQSIYKVSINNKNLPEHLVCLLIIWCVHKNN